MMFFLRNDPAHWCNLQTALTTLFRLATLDGYSDLVCVFLTPLPLICHRSILLNRYINVYGCDYWWTYGNGRPKYGFESKIIHKRDHSNCNHPHAWGWLAVVYFISFVVLGSQVLMTLFVGIVATAMEEAKAANSAAKEIEDRLQQRIKALNLPFMPPSTERVSLSRVAYMEGTLAAFHLIGILPFTIYILLFSI